jgi:hypothetical protein
MINRNSVLLSVIALTSLLFIVGYGIKGSFASGDDDYGTVRNNPTYIEECSACHMAYPPQLLPADSWHKMMTNLDDHFGENAELDVETAQVIEGYLRESTDNSKHQYRKLFRNLDNKSPLRITELPYFIRKHDEIPAKFLVDNDKLSSFSQCSACHKNAEKGRFNEDDVSIPGYGSWDD